MKYHDNLPQLLADLRARSGNTKPYLCVLHDERAITILNDVIRKGGGSKRDATDQMPTFLDYLCDFVIVEVELIAEEIDTGTAATYDQFIALTAKRFWAAELLKDRRKLDRLIQMLYDDEVLSDIISQKIGNPAKPYDLRLIVSESINKLYYFVSEGKYRGGNVWSFVKETAYNEWRNHNRKKNSPGTGQDYGEDDPPTAGFNPDEELIYKEYVARAKTTFKQLSDTCRRVLYVILLRPRTEFKRQYEFREELGYKSDAALNNAVSKCEEKWQEACKEKTNAL